MELILIFMLVTVPVTLESYFKLTRYDNDIALAICELTAANGTSFSVTIPELRIGDQGATFDFTEARENLGDCVHGDHFPDVEHSKVLVGTLTIREFPKCAVNENLTCFQNLDDGTTVLSRLKVVSSTPSIPPPTTMFPSVLSNFPYLKVIIILSAITLICIICNVPCIVSFIVLVVLFKDEIRRLLKRCLEGKKGCIPSTPCSTSSFTAIPTPDESETTFQENSPHIFHSISTEGDDTAESISSRCMNRNPKDQYK